MSAPWCQYRASAFAIKVENSLHRMGCTYAIWVIWQIPLIDRLDHIDRPYLKCQVILDFEQQCRLVKCHRTHAGPSALSFSQQGASIWIIKSKNPLFFLWWWKNGWFSDPISLLDPTLSVRWSSTLNSNADQRKVIAQRSLLVEGT